MTYEKIFRISSTLRGRNWIRFAESVALKSIFSVVAGILILANTLSAQGPKGKSFGIGLSLGEPTAVTARFWTSRQNSWDAAIGKSHIGNPHLHADYLWHINDAFDSRIVSLYAGVGAIAGFGSKGEYVLVKFGKGPFKEHWYYDADNDVALAAKGTFALNIIPRNTPIDIFLELNPVLGLSPGFGFDFMLAIGVRFYP